MTRFSFGIKKIKLADPLISLILKLILIGVLLSFNIMGFASDTDPAACDHSIPKTTDPSFPTGFIKFAEYSSEQTKLKNLAEEICIHYHDSRDVVKDTEKTVTTYLENTGLKNVTDRDLLNFFNDNKNSLHCPMGDGTGERRSFIKVSLRRRRYKSMVRRFLIRERFKFPGSPLMNFNAVDFINGKPETILDYIDVLIKGDFGDKFISDIKSIRRVLAHETKGFAAKKFVDLPECVKAKYIWQYEVKNQGVSQLDF